MELVIINRRSCNPRSFSSFFLLTAQAWQQRARHSILDPKSLQGLWSGDHIVGTALKSSTGHNTNLGMYQILAVTFLLLLTVSITHAGQTSGTLYLTQTGHEGLTDADVSSYVQVANSHLCLQQCQLTAGCAVTSFQPELNTCSLAEGTVHLVPKMHEEIVFMLPVSLNIICIAALRHLSIWLLAGCWTREHW